DQIKVANGVQYFVLDELVVVTQPVGVKDAVLVHHDGIIQTTPSCQAGGSQRFDFAYKTESARARDRFDVRVLRKIDFREVGGRVDGRMTEVNGKGQRETVVGFQPSPLQIIALALAHFNRLEHAQELLGHGLLLQAGGTQQIHKSAR